MISSLPLLLAAASVGVLHMSAPDHWATLIILGRVSKWNRSRLLEVGVMTAVGHACLSILLGFAIVVLGLIFSRQVSVYITEGTGLVMVVGGLIYGVRELIRPSEVELLEKRREEISTGQGSFGSGFRYFTVLGAALSPDLSILPIFLLAVPIGLGLAVETAVVFGIASVSALLLFLLLGTAGLARAFERIPSKYSDALVGFVIAAVGAYILIAG